jgi:hypothetical protein
MLFVFITTALCDNHTNLSDDKNMHSTNQRLEIQRKRFDKIEEFVSERKKLIQTSFAFNARSVQNREIDYLRRLERSSYNIFLDEKLALIGLIKVYTDLLFTDTLLMSDKYFSSATESFSTHKDISHKLISVLKKPRPGSYMEKTARILVKDMEAFQEELRKLERRRDISLKELAKWEKFQRENISQIIHFITNPSEKSNYGVIQVICYEKENPFIMINDNIVYQEHSIDNVKIVRIGPEKVEFKKNGKSWIQNIGEPANDYWKR